MIDPLDPMEVWNPLFSGVIAVSGTLDTGKTSFALNVVDKDGHTCPPDQMFVVDDDVKTKSMVESWLPPERYVDMIHETHKIGELGLWKWADALVNRIPDNTRLLIFDTWPRMNIAFHAAVVSEQTAYRQEYAMMAIMKSGQLWQEADRLEAVLLDRFLAKVPCVVLTSHMQDYRMKTQGGSVVVPGKLVPAFRKSVMQKSRMRVQFVHSPTGSKYPVGLMQKRLSDVRVNAVGRRETMEITPRRMPICNWDEILAFWKNPVELRADISLETTPEYFPNVDESHMMNGTLPYDQIMAWQAMAEQLPTGEEDTPTSGDKASVKDRVLALRADNKNAFQIAAVEGIGLSVPEIQAIFKEDDGG
ncbi:MAG: hypothetical protein IPO08_22820 [Xanthomonadales bacterium]|nr:hypothetical protein [Xanthomonadales bacterium]